MLKKKDCKVRECFSTHRREIVGAIFLVLATLLTLLTLSGLGILGMFVVGLFLSCHRHFSFCNCDCCETECETSTPKKTAAKKTTKS